MEKNTAQNIAEYVRMLNAVEREYGVDVGLTVKTRMLYPFVIFLHEYLAFRETGKNPDVLNPVHKMVN